MALLETLIGPIAAIIDKVIPDKEARARAKLELLELEGTQELRQIEVRLAATLSFAGDRNDLLEMIGNVLDNACKFAISEIRVTVSRHLERLRIEVEDDGPGIDPAKSVQIFQRGVRADSSPGQGIGLAVVTEIVHSYGGQIRVDESPLGGARFTLDLP